MAYDLFVATGLALLTFIRNSISVRVMISGPTKNSW